MTIAKLLKPKLPYEPLKNLQAVSLIGISPLVLTAQIVTPGEMPEEFLAIAQQRAAPRAMHPSIVARLAVLLSDISRTPEMRQKLFQQGWQGGRQFG